MSETLSLDSTKDIKIGFVIGIGFFLLVVFFIFSMIDSQKKILPAKEISFDYNVIKFSDIPGISLKAKQLNGELYQVDDDVIYYPTKDSNQYNIIVKTFVDTQEPSNEILLETDAEGFNSFTKEIEFIDRYPVNNIYIGQVASGGVDVLKSVISSAKELIVALIAHPYDEGEKLLKNTKQFGISIWDLIDTVSEKSISETKDDFLKFISSFWESYFYNICSEVSKEYDIDYGRLIFSPSRMAIEHMAYNRFSGRMAAELVLAYLATAKAIPNKNAPQIARVTEATRLLKYLRDINLIKPIVRLEKPFLTNHKTLVSNFKNTFQWETKHPVLKAVEAIFIKNGKIRNIGNREVVCRNSIFNPNLKISGTKDTNLDLMKKGIAPIGNDGEQIQLHHLQQKNDGLIIEMTKSEHTGHYAELHSYKKTSEIDRDDFATWRKQYWMKRAEDFS